MSHKDYVYTIIYMMLSIFFLRSPIFIIEKKLLVHLLTISFCFQQSRQVWSNVNMSK